MKLLHQQTRFSIEPFEGPKQRRYSRISWILKYNKQSERYDIFTPSQIYVKLKYIRGLCQPLTTCVRPHRQWDNWWSSYPVHKAYWSGICSLATTLVRSGLLRQCTGIEFAVGGGARTDRGGWSFPGWCSNGGHQCRLLLIYMLYYRKMKIDRSLIAFWSLSAQRLIRWDVAKPKARFSCYLRIMRLLP